MECSDGEAEVICIVTGLGDMGLQHVGVRDQSMQNYSPWFEMQHKLRLRDWNVTQNIFGGDGYWTVVIASYDVRLFIRPPSRMMFSR